LNIHLQVYNKVWIESIASDKQKKLTYIFNFSKILNMKKFGIL